MAAAGRRAGAGLVGLLAWSTMAASRPLRILPLGDSLTYGCGDQCEEDCLEPKPYQHDVISNLGKDGNEGSHYHPGQSSGYGAVPCSRCSGGYRGFLLETLFENGNDVEMVGNLENDDGNGRHEGHIGWRIDQLTANIDFSGGIGLGNDGSGGHPHGSMDGGAGWIRLQPDIILLHAGTNDIGQGADAQTVLDRLHMLLTGIVERTPQCEVYVATLISMLPYGPARPLSHTAVWEEVNREIPALVERFAANGYKVHLVAMHAETGLCDRDWALPLGSTGRQPECCPGKNHPTDAGYRRIAKSYFDSIKLNLFDVEAAVEAAAAAAAEAALGGEGAAGGDGPSLSLPGGLG